MRDTKTFQLQFSECKRDGFHGKGVIQKFKDYPELLPSPFSRAAIKINEILKEDPEFGFETIQCLRFGGECRSDNKECRKLRGWKD